MKSKLKFTLSSISFLILTTTSIVAYSCAVAHSQKYNVVSLDSSLSGNMAAIGFKPMSQNLYNNQTKIPPYIQQLNIPTEYGNQPTASNAEFWLNQSPEIMYGYAYSKPSNLELYGIKNYLSDQDFYNTNQIESLKDRVDQTATQQNKDKTWNWNEKLKFLANELNSKIKNLDGSSLFNDVNSYISNLLNKFNEKIKIFKEAVMTQNNFSNSKPTISFWGSNFGPNFVSDLSKYEEYGPNINFPSWLFDTNNSLGFDVAIPQKNQSDNSNNNENFKLRIFQYGGFNTVGWWLSTGEYSAKAVQEGFKNSSDYVVVVVNSSSSIDINDSNVLQTIKNNFQPILKTSSKISPDKNIIVVDDSFTIAPYDILGMEYSINLLAKKILSEEKANEINEKIIFDSSLIKTLNKENFLFN
ncbi:hypothetical protein [Mycoplasmoides pirum]|uniref:hypothetical protein n=1 Tax=Mycoplasmoides pirum TaxID=2122 RepID=UPI000484AD44|nr:hypothetical protein [Mycoplasmoides pirum]